MQSRRPLTMIFGLLALSAAASAHAQGLTIINTDSAVYEQQPEHTPPSSLQGSRSAGRSAPPLPGRSLTERRAGSEEAEGRREGEGVPMQGDSSQAWLLPDNTQQPRQESRQDQNLSQGAPAPNTVNQGQREREATKNRYEIKEEWLSDAVKQIAGEAGYSTTIWAIGENGESDFSLHSDLTLTGATAKDALAQLVMPYPIRLCLFNIDNVAKVVAAEESCQ